MAALETAASPNSLQNEFAPGSFHSNCEILQIDGEVSISEHLELSQEETTEGHEASSMVSGVPQRRTPEVNDPDDEDDMQFTMDDDVKRKPPNLHRESSPVQVFERQVSGSDHSTGSTVTSGRETPSENCVPIQEDGSCVYRQTEVFKVHRDDLCQVICRTANAQPLERNTYLNVNGVKNRVELQFVAHGDINDQGCKSLSLQTYFNAPDQRKNPKKHKRLQQIINSYHRCSLKVRASAEDTKGKRVIADKESQVLLGPDDPVKYIEVGELVSHDSIIYSDTKYFVFKVIVELTCSGKITVTERSDEDMVVVDYCHNPAL